MADLAVGVASTRDVSVLTLDVAGNDTEAGYVGYEMRIRALESATGGIVGASGSGYAIRRELHDIPLPQKLSRDFSAALTARKHGFRVVSVEDAICFVPRTNSLQRECKVRTIARGIDTLMYQRRLLDPFRHGAFAWKLWSHKVCRWLVPVSGVVGLTGIALLAPSYLWAQLALVFAGCMALVVAAAWRWSPERPNAARSVVGCLPTPGERGGASRHGTAPCRNRRPRLGTNASHRCDRDRMATLHTVIELGL